MTGTLPTLPQFLARCDAYGKAKGLSRATVSTHLLNDGKRLQAIADGADMTTGRLVRSIAKLAEMERAA